MADDPISSVAVAGTGIMGCGITELLSEKGVNVSMLGRGPDRLERAEAAIQTSRSLAVRRKRLTQAEADAARERVSFTADPAELASCEVLIEAVVEDLSIKQMVLSRLTGHLKSDALLCTNTSALSVSDLAGVVPGPERFVGMHFMNPPTTVNLVEIIKGDTTSETTVEQAKTFCQQIKRQFIVVDDIAGFVVNRLLMLLINESARMIEAGIATPQVIDKAMRLACGHPMGPAAVADFIGLDTVCEQLKTLAASHGERYAPVDLIQQLVTRGDVGRKRGSGLLAVKSPPEP